METGTELQNPPERSVDVGRVFFAFAVIRGGIASDGFNLCRVLVMLLAEWRLDLPGLPKVLRFGGDDDVALDDC
jgi:hypothetical protein